MFTKINDWNINYEVLGEGKPVILLHGWLANLETMRPIANNLSKNFKVFLVDVVGFGKSSLPEKPLNSDDFGNFLKKFISNLNLQNPILIGHSNGGRIIINACGRKLISPEKIILIDSAGLIPKRKLDYYAKVAVYKSGKFLINLLPENTSKKLLDKFSSKVGSADYKASAPVLKETMKNIVNENLENMLGNITCPTLLVWGTLDKDTPIELARKMEKLIPDCGLVEFEGCTHFSYLQNLNKFNVVANTFLLN